MTAHKVYPVRTPGPSTPPQYDRVVRSLTLAELGHEIAVSAGTPEYRKAVSAEIDRRRGA